MHPSHMPGHPIWVKYHGSRCFIRFPTQAWCFIAEILFLQSLTHINSDMELRQQKKCTERERGGECVGSATSLFLHVSSVVNAAFTILDFP